MKILTAISVCLLIISCRTTSTDANVLATRTTASLATMISQATALLQQQGTADDSMGALIAGETAGRIVDGSIQVLSLQELTSDDYQRIRHEFAQSFPKDYTFARNYAAYKRGSDETKFVLEHYAGWMWQERIYINPTGENAVSAQNLASTLAHETNHVLNRSEENYYKYAAAARRHCTITDIDAKLITDPSKQLREEYRSFYVEYLVSDRFAKEINKSVGSAGSKRLAEPQIRNVLTAHVRSLYDIAASVRLTQLDLADERLVPSAVNWSKTRDDTLVRDDHYDCW